MDHEIKVWHDNAQKNIDDACKSAYNDFHSMTQPKIEHAKMSVSKLTKLAQMRTVERMFLIAQEMMKPNLHRDEVRGGKELKPSTEKFLESIDTLYHEIEAERW